MRANVLDERKIAILATDGFEEDELFEPREALLTAAAAVSIVSLKGKGGELKAWKDGDWSGQTIAVDETLDEADPEQFDGLVLPGGVLNADKVRADDDAVGFVRAFVVAGKPIAAICHGAWVLIEAEAVEQRIMTSWPSLKTDLTNAGARWVDKEVVVDDGLVTSRKPEDLPAFCEKMIEEFAEGIHVSERSRSAAKLASLEDTNA